jgi:aminoglycoside phosphotransferase (APT) family kinase protein
MRLVLLEALPGVPQLGQLLKLRLRGMDDDDEEASTLEDALTVAASVASALHSASITARRRRTLDHELAELRAEIDAVSPMAAEFSAHMRRWLRRIESYAEESDPLPYRLNHGNFKHTKLIFDGGDVGLIDVDDLCQAEPALDLGHFQAYLRIVAQKTQRLAAFAPTAITDQLCAHFLEGYRLAAGDTVVDAERLRVRVSIYEAVTLLRAVVHSWQILKTSRIEHVIAVLEERLAGLPALDY